ncbi:hypothetical protein [Cupriavidus basilensis]|uniref:hypothetical protein n=1 Tax=Cupriavidus basilensis TaxID=68895 RepID=UPI001E5B5AC7|nr:hypothetical protein [Cupriavidus basilensis]
MLVSMTPYRVTLDWATALQEIKDKPASGIMPGFKILSLYVENNKEHLAGG